MITPDAFRKVADRFGHFASWAVWAQEGEKPKSNIGDLSVLDPIRNPAILETLHAKAVFLGLNISRQIETPLANFHDPRPQATDYKIRFALRYTPFWGAYMTDVIKDFEEKSSGRMMDFLRANPEFERENIASLRDELSALGVQDPVLVGFGRDAQKILNRHFKGELRVVGVPHYANYTSKESYRQQVLELLEGL